MSFAVRPVVFAVAFAAATAASAAGFPQFDAEPLKRGRAVWIGTCKDCHANADADAPQALDRKA